MSVIGFIPNKICGCLKLSLIFFFIVLAGMWNSPVHRQALVKESKSGNQFVKFINMLMNDTTFLLDESLESLKRIHEVQELISDETNWAKLPSDQQQSRMRQLNADERQCR